MTWVNNALLNILEHMIIIPYHVQKRHGTVSKQHPGLIIIVVSASTLQKPVFEKTTLDVNYCWRDGTHAWFEFWSWQPHGNTNQKMPKASISSGYSPSSQFNHCSSRVHWKDYSTHSFPAAIFVDELSRPCELSLKTWPMDLSAWTSLVEHVDVPHQAVTSWTKKKRSKFGTSMTYEHILKFRGFKKIAKKVLNEKTHISTLRGRKPNTLEFHITRIFQNTCPPARPMLDFQARHTDIGGFWDPKMMTLFHIHRCSQKSLQ